MWMYLKGFKPQLVTLKALMIFYKFIGLGNIYFILFYSWPLNYQAVPTVHTLPRLFLSKQRQTGLGMDLHSLVIMFIYSLGLSQLYQ
jgi:hypothetical protein